MNSSSSSRLFVAAFVLVSGLVGNSLRAQDPVEELPFDIPERTLRGRFTDPQVQETWTIRYWQHGLSVVRGEEDLWSEQFWGYVGNVGICRDLATGLDRIFYTTSSGGSDGAMTIGFLGRQPDGELGVLFEDRTAYPELPRYFHSGEMSQLASGLEYPDGWNLGSMEGLACAGEEYRSLVQTGEHIRRSLATGARLVTDEQQEVVDQVLSGRGLDAAVVETLLVLVEGLGSGFGHETIGLSDHWRFEQVRFYRYYDSWGVVLLQDRESGSWRSIYDIPQGDSKNYLIDLRIVALSVDEATINFCGPCNVGEVGQLNLHTWELTAEQSEQE